MGELWLIAPLAIFFAFRVGRPSRRLARGESHAWILDCTTSVLMRSHHRECSPSRVLGITPRTRSRGNRFSHDARGGIRLCVSVLTFVMRFASPNALAALAHTEMPPSFPRSRSFALHERGMCDCALFGVSGPRLCAFALAMIGRSDRAIEGVWAAICLVACRIRRGVGIIRCSVRPGSRPCSGFGGVPGCVKILICHASISFAVCRVATETSASDFFALRMCGR